MTESGSFIPCADPGAAYRLRKHALLDAVVRVFDSGRYILGNEVEAFEKEFAAYIGAEHVVGCASGTDALELALRAMGAGPGKAVFTVSHTASATVAAVERAGATPVLVDIDPVSYTMSAASLEAAVSSVLANRPEILPAVVIPVHLYGHPCDMDAVASVALLYGLDVLEDCSQAHGARYKEKTAGTLGRAAAFSCYPTKNLGALGDAGCVATNDGRLAERIASVRQYGWKDRYNSVIPGVNSRLDPVQAAALRVQLTHLEADNAARRRIAATYNEGMARCGLALPETASWAENVFHLYVVRCPERVEFRKFLHAANIGTGVHYPHPVHTQPAYKGRLLLAPDGLPVTERIADDIVSLPMFPQLPPSAVERICAAVGKWAQAGG
jgi:dTDP-4-amino-4,6-dideoxygalactose transaminase